MCEEFIQLFIKTIAHGKPLDWVPSLGLEINPEQKKNHNLNNQQYIQYHEVQVGCYQHDDGAWHIEPMEQISALVKTSKQ